MAHNTGQHDASRDSVGERAANSDWLDKAIRVGLVAYGVVHLLIAWLAFQLALGNNEGRPSNEGAMHQLAQQSFGEVLLWAIAIGMFFLVIWRLLEAALGHRDEDGAQRWAKRATSLGKAVVYGAVGYSALAEALGGASDPKGRSNTAKLMDLPAGQWLVGFVGIGIILYGAIMVRRGFTEKFREHLTAEGKSGEAGRAYIWFGKAGHIAKGASIALVGGLFLYAAVSHQPKKSGGLDVALLTVLEQPLGQLLLGAVAIGIACYGLFCFARARHLSK